MERQKTIRVEEYEERLKKQNITYFEIYNRYESGSDIYINSNEEAELYANKFIHNDKIPKIDYSKNTVFIVKDTRNDSCARKEVRVLFAEFKKKPKIYFKTLFKGKSDICLPEITGTTYAVVVPNSLLKNLDMNDWKLPSIAK